MPDQSSMTILVEVIPEQVQPLTTLLRTIGDDVTGAKGQNTILHLTDFPTIHFARWVLLPPSEAAPTAPTLLAFGTDHDGSDAALLQALVTKAPAGLDTIYRSCKGWPSNGDTSAKLRFLEEHRIPYAGRYIASRGRSVAEIKDAVTARRKLEDYVDSQLAPKLSLESAPLPPQQTEALAQQILSAVSLPAPTPPPPPSASLGAFALGVAVAVVLALVLSWKLTVGLVLLLVLAVGAFVAVLQLKNKQDALSWKPTAAPTLEKLAMLQDWENHVVQNQMTHIVDVRPGGFRRGTLRTVLKAIDFLARVYWNQGQLGGIPTIHFARWMLIDNGTRLLFFSNYDGSWENYLADFIDRAAVGLTGVWSNTVGFPPTNYLTGAGARHADAFKNWTRSHQIETQVWYSAYPDVSVQNVQEALELCREAQQKPATGAWIKRL